MNRLLEAAGLARPARSWTALVFLALFVSACGDDPAPDAPAEVAPPAAEAVTPEPAAEMSFDGEASDIERIVIVSIDTLRADHVGSYGATDVGTDTMDLLAAEGVRFSQAISPAPITLPSHSTLLTGLDPPQHGVRHNGLFKLEPDLPTLQGLAREAGFETAAFISAYVLDRQFGLDRGFDHYDDLLGTSNDGHSGPAVPARAADGTVDAALNWVETAPDKFLLFVHLYDPHADHNPPEPYRSQFGADRLYDAEIAFADAEVGRLLEGIASRWPNGTVVALTSDHGESFGEHGEPTHSLSIYEATQHIPLFVAGPGVPRAAVVDDVVRLSDVAPTLADLIGLSGLASSSEIHGGRSLRPLWEGAQEEERVAWVETLATQLDFSWSPLFGVRTGSHKYIRAPKPELYALESDGSELENVAGENPDLVAELDALVEARAAGRPIVLSTDLSADARAQLEALGYVTEGSADSRGELGVVAGENPADQMGGLTALFQGMNLLARREFEAALEKFEGTENRGLELSTLRGQAALGAQRFDVAREAAEESLRFAPHRGQPHVLLGQVEEAVGNTEEAKASYRRAIEVEPSQGAAWIGLGRIAEAAGDTETARSAYVKATEARVYEAEAIWRQAALAVAAGDSADARKLLGKMTQAQLRQPHVALRLAQAEQAAGKGDLARIRVAGGLRAYGKDVPLLLMDAAFKELDGDDAGALVARRQALKVLPESPRTMLAVSNHLSERGQGLEEAARLAGTALEKFGRVPPILLALAQIELAKGQAAEALGLVDEASTPGLPVSIEMLLGLRRAEALAQLSRPDEAQKVLAKVEAEIPDDPILARDLARTQRKVAGAVEKP